MIDIKKEKEKTKDKSLKNSSTQKESKITPDFYIQLDNNKHLRLYKSKIYNDYILTINTNNSKKIVITRSMWKILRKNVGQIDATFMAN